MKKAISLDVRLWIEGEDEPAHDFAQSTTKPVRDIIEAGAAKHPALTTDTPSLRRRDGACPDHRDPLERGGGLKSRGAPSGGLPGPPLIAESSPPQQRKVVT